MKSVIFLLSIILGLIGCSIGDFENSGQCSLVDPSNVVTGVGGDYELMVDPQDPDGNLIFTANLANGASSIVVARVDGSTGMFIDGSLTTIANNFNGKAKINGPEFVQLSSGGIRYSLRRTGRRARSVSWCNTLGVE